MRYLPPTISQLTKEMFTARAIPRKGDAFFQQSKSVGGVGVLARVVSTPLDSLLKCFKEDLIHFLSSICHRSKYIDVRVLANAIYKCH